MAQNSEKQNLKDLTQAEIADLISSLGKERYRAGQIMRWLYRAGSSDLAEMTTLAKDFRSTLGNIARISSLKREKTAVSRDGTKKILFRLADGHLIESVLIPGRNHWTICVSTQAGCRMGCRFCFTGKGGLKRNLLPSEITDQIIQARKVTAEGEEIKNCVLMGMGEPLDNYDNTLKAIRIMSHEAGLGFGSRRVTISTCGIVPAIRQLSSDVSVNLAVSLNAPDDETRSGLMPVNRVYPLAELLRAVRDFQMPGRRMVTFEYILIDGINSSLNDARELCRLLKNIRCKINLIILNEFPASSFRKPPLEKVQAFQKILIDNHFTAILRESRGEDIMAACGQLGGGEDINF